MIENYVFYDQMVNLVRILFKTIDKIGAGTDTLCYLHFRLFQLP